MISPGQIGVFLHAEDNPVCRAESVCKVLSCSDSIQSHAPLRMERQLCVLRFDRPMSF